MAAAVFSLILAAWVANRASPSTTSRTATRKTHPTSAPADIDGFLAAERRMLLGTWAMHAEFVRRTSAGRELTSTMRRVQRPPDSLSEGPASADINKGGRHLACSAGPTGGLVCRDVGPAIPFQASVDSQLAAWRSYLVATLPLYVVGTAPGAGPGSCWELTLAAPSYPSPPYGERAVFCYDQATGGPSYVRVERPEAVDTTTTTDIRATVTDADLLIEPPPGR